MRESKIVKMRETKIVEMREPKIVKMRESKMVTNFFFCFIKSNYEILIMVGPWAPAAIESRFLNVWLELRHVIHFRVDLEMDG